jgi:hypothetical protein
MTLRAFFPSPSPLHLCGRRMNRLTFAILIVSAFALFSVAEDKPPANPSPDVLILSNGDTLHGKFVNSLQGKVTFHSDVLGDISLTWDKIKELHTDQNFAVIDKNVKLRGGKNMSNVPIGTLSVENQSMVVTTSHGAAPAVIATKDAAFVLDEGTLNKDINHQPGFFAGWNGAATAGATLVTATENQYTFSGAIGLVRAIPTVSWLNPRDRTSIDFTGSYGKITQPGYFVPPTPPATTPTFVAPVTNKSAIYHADAERDQYFSPRVYVLGQTAFDHNYGQDLDLQQIYGGGLGWTVLKTPKQEADLKATAQYEKQEFISGSGGNQNLIGSTFSATYLMHTKLVTYTQGLSYIPAYNNFHAYSTQETDTFAFPAYKNLSFSLGTIDSYLNDPPASLPPTKRNSFQFTMGLTYAIKAKN